MRVKTVNGTRDDSFTINRASIMSETRRAFRIIPDSVVQYPDERIGTFRWRMSIEKAKRSLRCSFAWLRPGSRMALETHPGDFGTKSSARNSGLCRLSGNPQPSLSTPLPLFAARGVKLHIVFLP